MLRSPFMLHTKNIASQMVHSCAQTHLLQIMQSLAIFNYGLLSEAVKSEQVVFMKHI
jgi:hypothetical protein